MHHPVTPCDAHTTARGMQHPVTPTPRVPHTTARGRKATPHQEGGKPHHTKRAENLPATAANRRTDRLLHKLLANTQENLHPDHLHHHLSHPQCSHPHCSHPGRHARDLRKYPTQSSEPGASRPATLAATRSRLPARCPAHWRRRAIIRCAPGAAWTRCGPALARFPRC
jgi:hypothetical protein